MLIRSSHISTGSPVRRPIVPAISRAATALASSAPSPVSGRPTTTPTGSCSADQLEEAGHGEALARAAHQGLERGREDLGLVAQRQADAHVAPVHGDEAAGGGNGECKTEDGKAERRRASVGTASAATLPSFRFRLYCAIVAKNSLLFFVRFIRSSRNSSASTGGMSARKLRSR